MSNQDMDLKMFKEKWAQYEQGIQDMQKRKKPQTCHQCGACIRPGDTLWVKPMDDKVYCCAECFVEDHSGYVLEGSPGDNDYESWFEDNNGQGS